MEQHGLGALPPEWVELAEKASADAEQRTGVAAADWRVKEVTPVTWRDGSLGAPEPGHMYTMALVPGFRIVLENNGREMRYHTSRAHVKFVAPGLDSPGRGSLGL